MTIPVIDLFAGPGGLGEGFCSLGARQGVPAFDVALSIERDENALKTLKLRTFFRRFPIGRVPDEYYRLLRGEVTMETLFREWPDETEAAERIAWKAELGKETVEDVDGHIRQALAGADEWVLVGGPPCQAYSIVGRSRVGGIDPRDPRVYLYREYYRILAKFSPAVFVLENVKGLLSAKVRGKSIFSQILNDLSDPRSAYLKLRGTKNGGSDCPGYRIYSISGNSLCGASSEIELFPISDFVVRSELHGVPQARHRVIIVGVRNDISRDPMQLRYAPEAIPARRVLDGLPPLRSGLSRCHDDGESWLVAVRGLQQKSFFREFQKDVREELIRQTMRLAVPKSQRGGPFVKGPVDIGYAQEWYLDPKIGGACNHHARSHIVEDLYRYFYAACYANVLGASPELSDFPNALLPNHRNVRAGVRGEKFGDRFRVQLRGEPAKTITSHISKDGHYYIHPDPRQCRSLTVREAARLQTFPDNYFFCGPRTSQYAQVGNAVPPLLARQVAELVFAVLRPKDRRRN